MELIFCKVFEYTNRFPMLLVFKGDSYIRLIIKQPKYTVPRYDIPISKNDIESLFLVKPNNTTPWEFAIESNKHPMILSFAYNKKRKQYAFGWLLTNHDSRRRIPIWLSEREYEELKRVLYENMPIHDVDISDLIMNDIKHCNTCNTLKDANRFPWDYKTKKRRSHMCHDCTETNNELRAEECRKKTAANRRANKGNDLSVPRTSAKNTRIGHDYIPGDIIPGKKKIPRIASRAYNYASRLKKSGDIVPEPCIVCSSEEHLRMNHLEFHNDRLTFIWMCADCLMKHIGVKGEPLMCVYPKDLNRRDVPGLLLNGQGKPAKLIPRGV